MEHWLHNLLATSNALDAEVLAQYRRCSSNEEVDRWLRRELTQLAHTDLARMNSAQQEDWLKRLFANLRLYFLVQVGESAMMAQSHAAPYSIRSAQIEVLDILTAQGDWARLCALGTGTYEMLRHRLRAMTMTGSTLITTPDDYVTRVCTEHERLSELQAAVNAERNWLPLLLSLHQAIKASPLIEKMIPKVAAPLARKSEQRASTSAKPVQYPPVFSSWRERVVTFGCAFGVLLFGLAIGLGSPAWIIVQIQQRAKVSPVRKAASSPLSVTSALTLTPTITPTIPPTPEVASTPMATPTLVTTPTSEVAPTPVATPSPAVTSTERAGFYVIGMAARDEANAQAEAQQRRQEGLQPQVVYSSNWSGLTPNYYQVVYGIFVNRGDTAALRKDLEQRGIKTYVMHSGQRVRP